MSASKKRTIWIGLTTLLFVLLALFFFIYWWIWGQFEESTNDSYVNGNMIILTPQVEGIVTAIYVDNTELVEPGQPVIELDRHFYEIALDQAKAVLADRVRQVSQLFLQVEELEASQKVAMAALIRAALDYEHRAALVEEGGVAREEFEHSQTTLLSAYATLTEVEKSYEKALVEVNHTTLTTHPKVEQAKALLRQAFLLLHRCTVLAPTRGIISQRKAQVGQWVKAEDPLMALVPIDQIWVDANFREVSLKYLRIAQPVEMVSDMYGEEIKFHGQVVGLNPGTGSVFSILPPQNATGNWIKIVQRVPVKIGFSDLDELKRRPLLLGLSMTVTVDTHDRHGMQLPETAHETVLYSTSSYENELLGVEQIIDDIIEKNSGPMNRLEI